MVVSGCVYMDATIASPNRDSTISIGSRWVEEEKLGREGACDWSLFNSVRCDCIHVNSANGYIYMNAIVAHRIEQGAIARSLSLYFLHCPYATNQDSQISIR
ncbi:unnamed protein product, partial [Ixodes persulcatus]